MPKEISITDPEVRTELEAMTKEFDDMMVVLRELQGRDVSNWPNGIYTGGPGILATDRRGFACKIGDRRHSNQFGRLRKYELDTEDEPTD